ncbi:acyl-ACP thioesterase domain-containing protein [Streptococcus catagoni]|uniref:acyl-ACP thioesterase domain-containing protein n=1 Tax=Streptococcus catagoni TaxID=2654874 RepID=UPI00140796D3|nr:acyl-ACP thioesterase domain-containing protein [Streptococcus catagoni]
MGLKYKEKLTLPFDLCDVKHDAKLSSFLAYCLALSGKQSRLLKRSDEYILERYELVWIITDYEMTFERLPRFNESVWIETEATSYNKFFCYRQFRIFDADNHQIADILTHFALMSPESRKVAPIPVEIVEPFQSEFIKKLKRVARMDPLGEAEEKIYQVRYYDIDMNGHVNNSKYLDWIYDVLGYEFLHHHRPSSVQLKYVKEVAPGGQITSCYRREGLRSYHEIRSDDVLNAQAIIEWQKIES